MLKILLLLLMTFCASAQLLEEKLLLAHFMTGDIQKTIINGKPFNGVQLSVCRLFQRWQLCSHWWNESGFAILSGIGSG